MTAPKYIKVLDPCFQDYAKEHHERDIKDAFYAGAQAIFSIISVCSQQPDDNISKLMISNAVQEIREYLQEKDKKSG